MKKKNKKIEKGAIIVPPDDSSKVAPNSFMGSLAKKIKGLFRFFLYLVSILILAAIVIVISCALYFNNKYKDVVFPNVYFNGKSMVGKDLTSVELEVQKEIAKTKEELVLKYSENEVRASLADLGFSWDKDKTAENIFNIGKSGNYLSRSIVLATSFLYKSDIPLQYSFSDKSVDSYLKELATTIDKEPVDGKFDVQNGKVKEFLMGSNGQKLLIPENKKLIKRALIENLGYVDLVIEEEEAKGMNDMEEMGVKELVATGESNFAGSPPNRIHNISVGAQAFNGILIAPGDNFSFIDYLGEVSAKTGYLPELVIKEDKTIPEYGGGLCQVSTTFFRAAINAGLPIIERTAHAYRVSYYEPAGFDSTIYEPKPDLVFQNNTDKYILVQTRIEEALLFVDFYGTSDGRKVEVSAPTVYNYVQPGDPIITETTELAPGQKIQTDTAHVGADAYFDRVVTYADGTKDERRFSSRYIPWRAKFLVGKEVEPETPPEDTSTTNNSDTNTDSTSNTDNSSNTGPGVNP